MNNVNMIPWDVIIEILNKYQSYNPGLAAERANKYVNDEIYEWVNNQPMPVNEQTEMLENIKGLYYMRKDDSGYDQALRDILEYLVGKS